MRKLIRGLREFKDHHFPSHLELFEKLGMGQKPRVLFIFQSQEDPRFIGGMNCGQHILL